MGYDKQNETFVETSIEHFTSRLEGRQGNISEHRKESLDILIKAASGTAWKF